MMVFVDLFLGVAAVIFHHSIVASKDAFGWPGDKALYIIYTNIQVYTNRHQTSITSNIISMQVVECTCIIFFFLRCISVQKISFFSSSIFDCCTRWIQKQIKTNVICLTVITLSVPEHGWQCTPTSFC